MDHQLSVRVVLRLVFVSLHLWTSLSSSSSADKKLYIVYMGVRDPSTTLLHRELLSSLLGSEEAMVNSMVYSYTDSFSGFAASLTDREAEAVSRMSGVVSVFQSRVRTLHTTRSWDFLGLASYKNSYSYLNDVVVGVFDTGVWPESESFSDRSLGPVPARWKGACEPGVKCNRKLIGARSYSRGFEREFGPIAERKSPRDSHGHGTHTASIATGSPVDGANFFGLAQGVARGGAPAARLAMYKVCWGRECSDADVLAAFDDALSDGVDVLSISLGEEPSDYFKDAVAIGGFHAMQRDILTVVSAGNEGPSFYSAKNVAPWLFTVAASSIDRKFVTDSLLGNKLTYQGASINGFNTSGIWFPLVFAGKVGRNGTTSRFCGKETLDPTLIKGKIVLCYTGDARPDESVASAGGAGLLYVTDGFDPNQAFSLAVPANRLSKHDAEQILGYINSTRRPRAKFLPTHVKTGGKIKPTVALFSSRGPNLITPNILKPDVTAPGVDILGAWSPRGLVSGLKEDKRSAEFNILSGTSMSCPHVSGAAAHLRSIHPNWSASALKSALMTTATVLDRTHRLNMHGALAYGSGLINPTAATDPGLVYDISPRDYAVFLCSIGYNRTQVRSMLGESFICTKRMKRVPVSSLNYPSIALGGLESGELNITITRTVTNVGSPPVSTYHANVTAPKHVRVWIFPSRLRFGFYGERKSFRVKLAASGIPPEKFLEGGWEWNDGKHSVRSPIIILRKDVT